MPVLLIPLCICFLLGILNGCRCRLPDACKDVIRECQEESVSGMIQGTVTGMEYRENQLVLLIRTECMELESGVSTRPYRTRLYVRRYDGYAWEEDALSTDGGTGICIGNQIRCEAELLVPVAPTNPGEFNGKAYYQARGIDFLGFTEQIIVLNPRQNPIGQFLLELRSGARNIFYENLSEENAGMMSAMVLGTTWELDAKIRKLFQRNGIAHILAISALHISIIGGYLYRLLRKCGCSYAGAGVSVLLLLVSYGWLTGFSGSTIRAVIMFLLMIGADILGRTYDMLTAIGISCLCLLLENPYRLWDAGFLLSFSAVLSLGVFMPMLQTSMEGLRKHKKIRFLTDSLCSGLVVSVMTAPIIVYFYYDVPVYGVVLNLIVIPLMPLVIICGIGGLLVYPILPWLGNVVLLPCEWVLNLFQLLCRVVERLPGSIWHIGGISLWEIGIYYGVMLFLFFLVQQKQKGRAIFLCLLLLCGILVRRGDVFRIVMLDVGQGDSILLETPGHHYMLMDGGSSSRSSVGEYIITPAVKYYGSGCLDYVFVSHMDRDHMNGIEELIALSAEGEIRIRYLVVPALADQKAYTAFLERVRQAGIQILLMKPGDQVMADQVSVTCLYPDGHLGSSNNQSMVLSVSYGDFDMLFTGDLEAEGEAMLLETPNNRLLPDYDVLKAGHHGSSGSSSMQFLERIQPEIALISCGRNNTYGHPHPETMDRLECMECHIYCTMDRGAIELRTDGRNMKIHFFNAETNGLW